MWTTRLGHGNRDRTSSNGGNEFCLCGALYCWVATATRPPVQWAAPVSGWASRPNPLLPPPGQPVCLQAVSAVVHSDLTECPPLVVLEHALESTCLQGLRRNLALIPRLFGRFRPGLTDRQPRDNVVQVLLRRNPLDGLDPVLLNLGRTADLRHVLSSGWGTGSLRVRSRRTCRCLDDYVNVVHRVRPTEMVLDLTLEHGCVGAMTASECDLLHPVDALEVSREVAEHCKAGCTKITIKLAGMVGERNSVWSCRGAVGNNWRRRSNGLSRRSSYLARSDVWWMESHWCFDAHLSAGVAVLIMNFCKAWAKTMAREVIERVERNAHTDGERDDIEDCRECHRDETTFLVCSFQKSRPSLALCRLELRKVLAGVETVIEGGGSTWTMAAVGDSTTGNVVLLLPSIVS